jgi:plastocyanin
MSPGRVLVVTTLVAALCLGPAQIAAAQQSGPSISIAVGEPANLASWGFAPTVGVGQVVTWTNVGAQPHTATVQGMPWDTGIIAPGGTATLVFDTPGLYSYLCTVHPTMVGTISVTDSMAVEAPSIAIVEPDAVDVTSWTYAPSVQAGQSVTWINIDIQPHTATANDLAWDAGNVQPGTSAAVPFDVPGLYGYFCVPHPWMKGLVEVRPPAT